jgi:hypothetical protein
MNYDFYADRSDALSVIAYIFAEMDLQLFDLYSEYGEEVTEYKSVADVQRKFETSAAHPSALFQVWSPRHRGKPFFRKLALDPDRCDGHTFRYSTNGWGLIQLYFYGPSKRGLGPSHIGHFEERGAYSRESLYEEMGKASEWDWREIRRTSRALKYHIQKRLSVSKVSRIDTRDILPALTGCSRLALPDFMFEQFPKADRSNTRA